MSTRSLVAVGNIMKFDGRYCHSDGYPSGVGKSLWDNWHNTFKGDLQKVAKFVLRTEYGWSNIVHTDFSLQPRWYEYSEWEQYSKHPRWYDTRASHLRGYKYTISDASQLLDSWMEWGYFINLETNAIDVYKLKQTRSIFMGTMLAGIEPDYDSLETK